MLKTEFDEMNRKKDFSKLGKIFLNSYIIRIYNETVINFIFPSVTEPSKHFTLFVKNQYIFTAERRGYWYKFQKSQFFNGSPYLASGGKTPPYSSMFGDERRRPASAQEEIRTAGGVGKMT